MRSLHAKTLFHHARAVESMSLRRAAETNSGQRFAMMTIRGYRSKPRRGEGCRYFRWQNDQLGARLDCQVRQRCLDRWTSEKGLYELTAFGGERDFEEGATEMARRRWRAMPRDNQGEKLVLPHRGMLPRRILLPHEGCSRCAGAPRRRGRLRRARRACGC
jgi:hypothetical protein